MGERGCPGKLSAPSKIFSYCVRMVRHSESDLVFFDASQHTQVNVFDGLDAQRETIRSQLTKIPSPVHVLEIALQSNLKTKFLESDGTSSEIGSNCDYFYRHLHRLS